MNFGELKTTVFARLPKKMVEQVSVFEFGEAIDAAQRLFAAVLPSEVVPEILIESFIDRSDEIGAEDFIPLPDNYLRVETVHFAQARAEDFTPIRRPARIVQPLEFEALKHSGTEEQLVSVFNNLLHFHPAPCAGLADNPAAIKLVYRKIPRPYMTTAGILQKGARLNLRQDIESRHTFVLSDYTDGDPKPFSFFELDANEVPGGYAFIGSPALAVDKCGPIYVCRIVMAWDHNIGTEEAPVMAGHIRISSDDAIPFANEDDETGFMFPWCYISHRQIFGASGNAIEAEDWEFPDLGPEWHNMICDYALARIEVGWNPNGAMARENRVLGALAAVGAKLEMAAKQ